MSATTEQDEVVPRVREGIDIMKLGLTALEGFVVSRIDGHTSVATIAQLVGKPAQETQRIIERLSEAGVVMLGRDDPNERQTADLTPEAPEKPWAGMIFPAHLMHEECDLDEEERKRIAWFHESLESWNHYDVLKAKRAFNSKEIKRAYFERSKEWHPDRFRRPNLGSFKPMIDAIFKRIQESYSVLSNDETKQAYDATCIFAPDEDEMAEMLRKKKREERDKLREEESVRRRKKKNPLRKRIDKAREFYEKALQLEEKEKYVEGLRAAQTALTFDKRPEYEDLVERLKQSAVDHRIGPYMKRGVAAESLTNWHDAIEVFEDALQVAPNHASVHLRLAFNLLMAGKDPKKAASHANKAIQGLPEEPEAHFVLGLCYEKDEKEKAAVRSFSKALELKPNYQEAKKRLKKLKWGF